MKKKLASLSLAGVLLIVPLSTSIAATEVGVDNTIRQGTYNYDTNTYSETINGTPVRDGIKALVSESAGGGSWDHGFIGIKSVYSDYNHTGKTHRSSASNFRSTDRAPWKSKYGGWTYASIAQSLWGNKANWNTK